MQEYVIGCDNAAVSLKNTLKDELLSMGYKVEDVGCYTPDDPEYYPYIAKAVCENIIESGYQKHGVLICGTGLGVCMAANKFKGIRAGVCHDSYSAERLALSNDGNVICFGARVIGAELAKKVLREWIGLKYQDGPSTPKVAAIMEIENERMRQEHEASAG